MTEAAVATYLGLGSNFQPKPDFQKLNNNSEWSSSSDNSEELLLQFQPDMKCMKPKTLASKRERNKISASKYRQKRKKQALELERKMHVLTNLVSIQKKRIFALHRENKTLKMRVNLIRNVLCGDPQAVSPDTPSPDTSPTGTVMTQPPSPPLLPATPALMKQEPLAALTALDAAMFLPTTDSKATSPDFLNTPTMLKGLDLDCGIGLVDAGNDTILCW